MSSLTRVCDVANSFYLRQRVERLSVGSHTTHDAQICNKAPDCGASQNESVPTAETATRMSFCVG